MPAVFSKIWLENTIDIGPAFRLASHLDASASQYIEYYEYWLDRMSLAIVEQGPYRRIEGDFLEHLKKMAGG